MALNRDPRAAVVEEAILKIVDTDPSDDYDPRRVLLADLDALEYKLAHGEQVDDAAFAHLATRARHALDDGLVADLRSGTAVKEA